MARLAAAQLADQIGLDTIQKHCVVTSVSELASNILVHACSGSIALSTTTRSDGTVGLEVLAADRGRGIRDIGQALQDGFSTRGGLGGGLPAVRRLMSELAITSAPARGTTIRATKWLREPSPYALSCLEPEPSATNRPATRGPPARADGPTTCAERPYTPRMSSDPPLPR